MRLHPRLFNRFLAVAASISVVAIIAFGFRHAGNQERDFRALLGDGQSLLDSLSVGQDHKPLVVVFWASWSATSVSMVRDLAQDTTQTLIAAYVRDDSTSAYRAFDASFFPHVRVMNGTAHFQAMKTPGVPTRIRYAADGRLHEVVVGTP